MFLKDRYEEYKKNIELINNSDADDETKEWSLNRNWMNFCDYYGSLTYAYKDGFAKGYAETQQKLYNRAYDEAYEEGFKKAEKPCKINLAKGFKKAGSPIEDIVAVTKLPADVIQALDCESDD